MILGQLWSHPQFVKLTKLMVQALELTLWAQSDNVAVIKRALDAVFHLTESTASITVLQHGGFDKVLEQTMLEETRAVCESIISRIHNARCTEHREAMSI